MTPLPRLMVAPNGARRGKANHRALPITDNEIVGTALECQYAGADGIHVHIRDDSGRHLIDAGRYRALLDRLETEVPGLYLQVTSEAAGRYEAAEQQAMMRALGPANVSVGLREMVRTPDDWPAARDFYHWAADAGVEIQHILYAPDEVRRFVCAVRAGHIPGTHHLIQLVQGTYADGSRGAVDLETYLEQMNGAEDMSFDWMLCAFGDSETASVIKAAEYGGKARVGFENSLHNADGSVAPNNAARIREVDTALRALAAKLTRSRQEA